MADMSKTTQSSASNRRTSKRHSARLSVTIEVRKGALGMGANIAAQFLDISEGGVRVIIKSQLNTGDEVEITLTGHGVNKPIKRLAKIAWAEKLESGQFLMGCLFDKRLTYADVTKFAKPMA